MPNTLKASLKQSIKAIKKHKLLFLLLFLTQLFFLIISSAVFVNFSISIGENIRAFVEPLENISAVPEEELITSLAPMMEKYGHYKTMLRNLTLFIVTMIALYIVINSINWSLSSLILNEKSLFLKYQIKFGILFLIFILPVIAIINFTAQYVFSIDQIQTAIPFYIILSLIFLYLMYISFASINKIKKLNQIPEIIKKAFLTGVKKANVLILTILITTGLPVLALYIISTQLEANFLLLLFLIAVFIILINWGRITLLLAIKNLEKS